MYLLTATYNSDKTIDETINSIESQSFKNIKWIVIDGQSTDSTLEKIKNCKINNEFVSEYDSGIFSAYNKGLRLLSRKKNDGILNIMDSDNFFANNNVSQKVYDIFNNYKGYLVHVKSY